MKFILDILAAPINLIKASVSGIVQNQVIKKGTRFLVEAIIGFLTAPYIAPHLQEFGVTVDPNQLAIGIGGFAEGLRTYLKHKFPKSLGWL